MPKSSRAIRDWADLDKPGRDRRCQAGTVMEPVMKQSLEASAIDVQSNRRPRVSRRSSQAADAFMTDYPTAAACWTRDRLGPAVSPPQPFHVTDYAYAFAPGDATLLDRVNRYHLVTARRDDPVTRVRGAASSTPSSRPPEPMR